MLRPSTRIQLIFSLALFLSVSAEAAVYKCVEPDGAITFAQTPCENTPATVTVVDTGNSTNSESQDCRFANKFAYQTAKTMRSGATSTDAFNQYGGLDSLSSGAINLINYVYSFRSNDKISTQRIAGLSSAKCQVRSFGDVGCDNLPISFTDRLGGCDGDEEETAAEAPSANPAVSMSELEPTNLTTTNVAASTSADSRASDAERIQECKDRYQDQIDQLDQQMRSGYSSSQSDGFRERRRRLRQQKRDCQD